ncbi:Uncharacterised protein [Raoultella terrigena]|uniref:Dihydroorotase n=1 Tax=Raoultella terrigena TaxID=577 RepID=A0A3P8JJ82_RAOTE|nr:Uncharacterised protein [Raoultella terrigena]
MSILILKNATAAQIYPAKVMEGIDIAIENDAILDIAPGLASAIPRPGSKRCTAGW